MVNQNGIIHSFKYINEISEFREMMKGRLMQGSCRRLKGQSFVIMINMREMMKHTAFIGSEKKVFKIMSRHFKVGFFAQSTLSLFCYAFSFCVTLATWAWIDDRFNAGSLPEESENYMYLLMFIGQLFTIWYPVLGLYVIIFIDQQLKGVAKDQMRDDAVGNNVDDALGGPFEPWNKYWIPPMAAAFVGCISMMFFTFLAKMFLDTLDTLFLCYAIDKDNGVDMSTDEFDTLVKKMPEFIEADVVTVASAPDPEIAVATAVSTSDSKKKSGLI